MNKKLTPDQTAKYFFQSLMHNQCHICWGLFSKASQDKFIDWTLKDIYTRHKEAAQFSKIGPPEVRLLFENNDASLMKSFWKYFFFKSNSHDFFRFGYFKTRETQGNKAFVDVLCQYPDGRRAKAEFVMLHEKGSWRFGYVESKLPF